MAKTNGKKVGKVLTYVLLVLCLVGAIGCIAYFTNGLTSDFATFYVKVNDETIMTENGGYVLTMEEPLTVDVKYTFEDMTEENLGYDVKVVPNTTSETNFDFYVDGEAYSFGAETDLTEGFNIVKNESSFTIAPKGSIKNILGSVYEGYEIQVYPDLIDFSQDLFKIIVTSHDGSSEVFLTFGVENIIVDGLVLDQTEIIF